MAVGVALEQLLGGAVLQTVWAWLPNSNAPSKLLVPAGGASISLADRASGDEVSVFADDTLSGAPLAQPLTVDSDGHVAGFVAQPQRLTATVQGAGLDPRAIPIGSDRDPVSITDVHVVASHAAMLAIAGAHQGTVAVRTDLNNSAFMHNGGNAGTDADWVEIGFVNVVTVNGQAGIVVLSAADVGADPSGAAAAATASALQKAQNLADLPNAATARTNLGLGSAATQATGAFDAAGAAATAQANAQAASIPLTQKAVANGVASLGADGKVPSSQLPATGSRSSQTVAYAATVTPTLPAAGDLVFNPGVMTGPMVVGNPSGTPTEGQRLVVKLRQDATGGRVPTFGNAYSFGATYPQSAIPTTANSNTRVEFEYDSIALTWWCVDISTGYAGPVLPALANAAVIAATNTGQGANVNGPESFSFAKAVPAGQTVVVALVGANAPNGSPSSFTFSDSKGNVYTRETSIRNTNNSGLMIIASSKITNAIAIGDTLTINWTGSISFNMPGVVYAAAFSGAAAPSASLATQSNLAGTSSTAIPTPTKNNLGVGIGTAYDTAIAADATWTTVTILQQPWGSDNTDLYMAWKVLSGDATDGTFHAGLTQSGAAVAMQFAGVD